MSEMLSPKKHKRNDSIDIIKSLGIICMVFGHCGFPFTQFIYLFHMTVFFMASGYCFSDSSSANGNSVVSFIIRRLRRLWIPYVLSISFLSLFHNFFIKIHIYAFETEYWSLFKMIKNIFLSLFLSGTAGQMGGALWFIAILMKTSLLYCLIDFLLRAIFKNRISTIIFQCFISCMFLCIGYLLHLRNIETLSLDKVLSYYSLFFIGYLLKIYNLSPHSEWKTDFHFIFLLIVFLGLCFFNTKGKIALDKTNYENPCFLLLVSIFGWYFLYEISFLLQKTKISHYFIYLGQHTLPIVIMHFLCFKIITFLQIIIYSEVITSLSAYPVLYSQGLWWVAYSAVGITLPLLFDFCYRVFRKKIRASK